MSNINPEDIVVSFWAIGPTFIKQLKKTIDGYLTNNFGDVYNFTVLTDQPDKFQYLMERTPRCLAILDINEERKEFPWSFEYEKLPVGKTDEEYTAEFRKNLSSGHRFSYSLHRFALPWIIKNGYTKFIIIDPDVHFVFKHPNIESLHQYTNVFFSEGHEPKITTDINYVLGTSYYSGTDLVYRQFYDAIVTEKNISNNPPTLFQTNDGPFRFYNLESTEKVSEFFDVWNTAIRLLVTDRQLSLIGQGSIFLNDEFLLGAVYAVLGLQVGPVPHPAINIIHRVENRHFMPSSGFYKLADSLEEFLKINQEELDKQYPMRYEVLNDG